MLKFMRGWAGDDAAARSIIDRWHQTTGRQAPTQDNDFAHLFVAAYGAWARSLDAAGAVRFRPILLTSLTTFAGLTPMLLETDLQARFLIPMAVSLGFGILFATAITLILVPCVYLMMADVKRLFTRG